MGLDRRSPAFAHTQTARRNEEPETTSSTGEIIKSTYRTLMTRGMRGCYVYATDPALRDYLKTRTQEAYQYEVASV